MQSIAAIAKSYCSHASTPDSRKCFASQTAAIRTKIDFGRPEPPGAIDFWRHLLRMWRGSSAAGGSWDLIASSILTKHSGPMKVTTHLDHIGHCNIILVILWYKLVESMDPPNILSKYSPRLDLRGPWAVLPLRQYSSRQEPRIRKFLFSPQTLNPEMRGTSNPKP